MDLSLQRTFGSSLTDWSKSFDFQAPPQLAAPGDVVNFDPSFAVFASSAPAPAPAPEPPHNVSVSRTGLSEEEQIEEAIRLSKLTFIDRSLSQDDGRLIRSQAYDITEVFGLLSKHGGERFRLFGLQYGVRLFIKHPDGTPIRPKRVTKTHPKGYKGTSRMDDRVLMEMEGTVTALTVAQPEFEKKVLENASQFQEMCQARWRESVFLFADNSNIFISAQYENGDRDLSVRVSVPNLCDVVRFGRHPQKQFVAGSHFGQGPPVWKASYENENFEVYVQKRHTATATEQGVDEVLHAQAMVALSADFGGDRLSQTLILLTGDGHGNSGRSSFPVIITAFMRHNLEREMNGKPPLWKVEIVTWKSSLSQQLTTLRDTYSGYVFIRYLDEYRSYVTYKDHSRVGVATIGKGKLKGAPIGKGKSKEKKGANFTIKPTPGKGKDGWDYSFKGKGKVHGMATGRGYGKGGGKGGHVEKGGGSSSAVLAVSEGLEGGDNNECLVCMENEASKDIFLSPCRHRGFCLGCAGLFVSKPCPVCRTVVAEVLQLY
jgi:hypothetical protein